MVGVEFVSMGDEDQVATHVTPLGHLAGVVGGRVYTALKKDKEMSSTE